MQEDYGYRPIGETLARVLEILATRTQTAGAVALRLRIDTQGARAKVHRLRRYHLVRPQGGGTWEVTLEGRKALAAHLAAKEAWEKTR